MQRHWSHCYGWYSLSKSEGSVQCKTLELRAKAERLFSRMSPFKLVNYEQENTPSQPGLQKFALGQKQSVLLFSVVKWVLSLI